MEKKFASQYRNEGFLSPARRIYASLLDALILIVVSFGLILAASGIAGAIPSYSSKIESINSLRIDMYKLEEETNLFVFPTLEDGSKDYGNPISQDEVFKRYVLSNVLLSYSEHQADWDAKYTRDSDDPNVKKEEVGVEIASFDNDYLAYFFVPYAKANNENENLFALDGLSYEAHYQSVLKNHSKGAEWDYKEGGDSLPSLKMDYAYTLYRYTFFGEGGQEGLNAYNFLISQYQGVFNEAGQALFQSDRYQAIYTSYRENYASCSKTVSLFSFLGYLAAYLLAYLLPTLLTKNGQSIGLLAFKGAVIHKEGLEGSKGQFLLRGLVGFFSFFPTLFFSCFFAGGLESGWMYPLFSIGGAGVSLFNLTILSFAIPIIGLLFLLIRKDHRSLAELASNTIVIDTRYYQDHRNEEEAKAEEAKEKEATKNVLLDSPYFDSTSFDNTERKTILEPQGEKKQRGEAIGLSSF